MASYFQNTMKTLRNALNGRYLIGRNKISPQQMENKAATASSVNSKHSIHLSAKQDYPQAEPLPLPINIDPSESTHFSPQRARDISSSTIAANHYWNGIDITVDSSSVNYDVNANTNSDPHVNSYDCTGAVSLNSSMQTNVPSPFGGMHKFTHLNMPGGLWEQTSKIMSNDLHSSHYINLRRELRKNWSSSKTDDSSPNNQENELIASTNVSNTKEKKTSPQNEITHEKRPSNINASDAKQVEKDQTVQVAVPLTAREKLKQAVKDYGITVMLFHVAISLVSLGFFYQLVSSGLDVIAILEYLGLGSTSTTISNNVTAGASTFVIAYAVHKVFAPLRISITLVSAPFIVRFLRKRGILAAKNRPKLT